MKATKKTVKKTTRKTTTKKNIKTILAIESSCDETAIAIIQNGTKICSNVIYSQIKTHKPFGGVVPEYASRMHTEKIHYVLDKALKEANLTYKDMDAIAVTYGPGLEGCLLVGLACAKSLSYALDIPLIPVNHLHGHIYANFLESSPPKFPFICLIVSGGHTQLLNVKDHYDFDLLGETRDDAAGEAFDKVARYLELPYPGGPEVEKEAVNGDVKAFSFPRAMKHRGYEFSFSGLKTAVIQCIQGIKKEGREISIPDICASFQEAVIDVLVYKSLKACEEYGSEALAISGGVTANRALCKAFEEAGKKQAVKVSFPPPVLCTDNAAMIGAAGFFKYKKTKVDERDIRVKSNLAILDI